jgi:nucleotide-binding universal stress UspA family protein
MTRIIVPTDFSDTAYNAASYAIKMAADLHGAHVTLYNCFDKVAAGADGTPLSGESDTRMRITILALQNLKERLDGHNWAKIDILAEEGSLIPNLEALVKREKIDLVVMGINGATRIEQIMIGSTTLGLVNRSVVPVMIIPPDAQYRKIRKILYSSDMKQVEDSTPAAALKNIIEILGARLSVGHVSHDYYGEVTQELKMERRKLNEMLVDYEPDYHILPWADFTDSINKLAEEIHADLVVTVPRKHSFLNKLFTTSHTKKLAYHSHLPVLALPE